MNNIKNKFPTLNVKINNHPLVYLDSAATSLKPQCVIDKINNYYTDETSNVHRGAHYLSELSTNNFEETRKHVQKFINAKSEKEIIFTKGTTESINLLAYSLSKFYLKKSDQICLSTLEHHSNIIPWQQISKELDLEIVEIPIDDKGYLIIEEYEKILSSGKVKIVALTHISNAIGTYNDIERLVKLCHNANGLFVLDAAQSIPHIPVDVVKLDCDFMAFSGHKMYGPNGVGILYGKEDLLEKMPPYQTGGGMIEDVTIKNTTYSCLPHKFEAGTPIIAEVITFKESLKFIENIGFNEIKRIEEEVTKYAKEQIEQLDSYKIIGCNSPIITFVHKKFHHIDIGILLSQQGVSLRTGHHCTQPLHKRFNISGSIRASFGIYNNTKDVDKLVEGLKKAEKLLK